MPFQAKQVGYNVSTAAHSSNMTTIPALYQTNLTANIILIDKEGMLATEYEILHMLGSNRAGSCSHTDLVISSAACSESPSAPCILVDIL